MSEYHTSKTCNQYNRHPTHAYTWAGSLSGCYYITSTHDQQDACQAVKLLYDFYTWARCL